MRALLFELEVRPRPKDDDERNLFRTIKNAGEYRFGWSRRGTLKRQLNDAVVSVAKELGTPRSEVREMLESPGRSEESARVAATVVSQAMREMAVDTETERHLRERIAALEAEVARLKR